MDAAPVPGFLSHALLLSLLLFVLGRYEESVAGKRPEPAKRAGPGRSS